MAKVKIKGDTFTINGVKQCIVHEFDTDEMEQELDRLNTCTETNRMGCISRTVIASHCIQRIVLDSMVSSTIRNFLISCERKFPFGACKCM